MSTIPSISPATGGKERRARKAKVILNRNNAQEILKALKDPSSIDRLARFVPQIGETLVMSRDGIDNALHGAAAGGFELQHVEEIRYGINRAMWESRGIPLKDFVETLAREVTL